MMRVLLLGGTTEASQMARILADADMDAIFSYAGRTASPRQQPLPVRIGGFGGVEGLVAYLREAGITHVIDATHPFAANMSTNAVMACSKTGIPLLAFERAPWCPQEGDNWLRVADESAAAAALPVTPARVFLAIGRQLINAFAQCPHHEYLLRLVDPPEVPLPLPRATVIIARGPFTLEGDRAVMETHGITHVVAKNAGGIGARSKLDAARALGLPVILIDRPVVPSRPLARTAEAVMAWLTHSARLGV
ncbi:cobalt-precorrin-6A reductase [Acetobacter tropicalis]|uniref:Cobalt-precorrin-6x reductase n=1 Tax=Acetobacter tropicalis TaxID=104102 RepID=A0A095AZL7_9PROT|nr:cobalt-precorrin-6A reductase [Acetobacter tropicalis]KAA8384274.1 cobalt-precorrin-6A reductase [Acetobacter tropicalis]KAA8384610.1 cobalt-precorrin-6A reductase [Acetobacter tropicalis]KGB22198.1 Cobalt-precorrin-6x reductase [Acetobacter tropicalis]MDO8173164.1 cobalt-precorrin-6A reductase [Acetobacter tropicalis]